LYRFWNGDHELHEIYRHDAIESLRPYGTIRWMPWAEELLDDEIVELYHERSVIDRDDNDHAINTLADSTITRAMHSYYRDVFGRQN